METMYLVTYFRHNKTTGGNSYKVDSASADLREAKKKYYALLGEMTDSETFDYVMVMLTDSRGNKIMSDIDSEPTTTPVIDEKQIAIDTAIANYKANPTDENLEKIKEAVTGAEE